MKYKTVELEDALLDAAAAKAEGQALHHRHGKLVVEILPGGNEPDYDSPLPFCSDWRYGGPIIEREKISLWAPAHPHWDSWAATSVELQRKTAGIGAPRYGPTPLIAAMRAFVTSKFGDEVELP